jgi:hypothetical protein
MNNIKIGILISFSFMNIWVYDDTLYGKYFYLNNDINNIYFLRKNINNNINNYRNNNSKFNIDAL